MKFGRLVANFRFKLLLPLHSSALKVEAEFSSKMMVPSTKLQSDISTTVETSDDTQYMRGLFSPLNII